MPRTRSSRRTTALPTVLAAAVLAVPCALTVPAPAQAHGGAVGGHGAQYFFRDSPVGETSMVYGRAFDEVAVGDWDGDGDDSMAVRRGRTYFVTHRFSGGEADVVVDYGRPDDVVLVGDWDGDGVDTLAVRRGATYYVKNSLDGGEADHVVTYGRPTDVAVVGDWDGDGVDTLGVRRRDEFLLHDVLGGSDRGTTIVVPRAVDRPLTGDWDGDGRDDVAVRTERTLQTVTQAGRRASFDWGRVTDHPMAGDWDGDGDDSLALRRPAADALPSTRDLATPADMVLRAARTRIGGQYVFGDDGPKNFDCSGLTQWAYRFVGVELPRYSGHQPAMGRQVSAWEAKPGDLVWWPGHVGIYVGNGMMVDAASVELGISERQLMPSPTFYRML